MKNKKVNLYPETVLISFLNRHLVYVSFVMVSILIVAIGCGGSETENEDTQGVVIVGGEDKKGYGGAAPGQVGQGSSRAVGPGISGGINVASGLAKSTPTMTTNTGQSISTPTPPAKTTEEKITGRLVDELSSSNYPRTNARVLEREFRKDPEALKKIGKSFVIQGDVIEAGKNDAGKAFVHFKAGAGKVTCYFEKITDAELLRFAPNGTNAVVGVIESWDAEKRHMIVNDCRVVLGF